VLKGFGDGAHARVVGRPCPMFVDAGKEIAHRQIKKLCYGVESSGADAVDAFFVFFNLLEADANGLSEFFLRYALGKTCGPHPPADMNVRAVILRPALSSVFLKIADISVHATARVATRSVLHNAFTGRLRQTRSLSNRQISAPAARSAGRKSYVSQKVQFPSAAQSMLTRPSTWASTKTPHVLHTGHCHIQPTSGRLRNCSLRSLPNGVSYSGGTYISLHRALT
jgi:hypothetical protein